MHAYIHVCERLTERRSLMVGTVLHQSAGTMPVALRGCSYILSHN